MNSLSMDKVNMFYDLIDEACMLLYDEINLDYLNALIRVGNDIVFQIDDSKITLDTYNKLKDIYANLNNKEFYSEEIRLAFELLFVKAFKHAKMNLDLFTPDTICYLFSTIIKDKFEGMQITILDTLLGTSNLLQAIANNINDEVNLVGIENNLNLVKLSEISSNLQNNEIKIYFQDALNSVFDQAEVVIGDLEGTEYKGKVDLELSKKGVTYFPYLVIEKRLENIKDYGYFMYVIDNDFFNKKGINDLKDVLKNKATLMALITLPSSIVQENHPGKSILIGKKEVLDDYNISVLSIDSFERSQLEDVFVRLEKLVREI